MAIAIKAEHVSKEYRLGIINHGMLFKDLKSWWAKKRGKEDPYSKIGTYHFDDQPDRFWALKDVSFEIEQGDRVGIIGRNGAGKSTLLKILSRITEPTEGKISIRGRVASLLEVGTGFHQELTGRDNIYLSGAIRGMKKREIDKKIDEIIAFSEIEKFIDTPVKRYSSGMFVRLGFAVAAFLDSEILIADEVLAVGDQAFQEKCLEKMEAISRNEGRTILFVSHNLNFISTLCQNAMCLNKGNKEDFGSVDKVIPLYYSQNSLARYISEKSTNSPEIAEAWIENENFQQTDQITNGDTFYLLCRVKNIEKVDAELKILVDDSRGRPLWSFTHNQYALPPLPRGRERLVRIKFSPPRITGDRLNMEVLIRNSINQGIVFDRIESYLSISIIDRVTDTRGGRYPHWPIFCDSSMTIE